MFVTCHYMAACQHQFIDAYIRLEFPAEDRDAIQFHLDYMSLCEYCRSYLINDLTLFFLIKGRHSNHTFDFYNVIV